MDVLHVEVCQRIDSALSHKKIEELVKAELYSWNEVNLNIIIHGQDCSLESLKCHVESILCYCDQSEKTQIKIQGENIKLHIYRLVQKNAEDETMQNDSEELAVASHWVLPAEEFHNLWENLFYEANVKENLLHFVETTLLFSDRNVDSNIISSNKVILLHGPPGTGKTSLCKALAQKVTIHLNDRYTHGELVEINSHSLFSKWFSESGKLVMKMFAQIKNLLKNPQALVCVLIDEVESLAHARKSCTNGIEPSDSLRVVNALLTQLDYIKRYPNVLILTTSNVTEAIDLAFVDRADIKQYIGEPNESAIYKIYSSCLKELMRTGFIDTEVIYDMSQLKMQGYVENLETAHSVLLLLLSRQSVGLSGRALRKIPLLAHALYLRTSKCNLARFMKAMHLAVPEHKENTLD